MRILNLSLTAVLILLICGCSPSIVSPDSAVYSTGKLYAVSSADMTKVYEASLAAAEQLELNVTEHAKDAFSASVKAKTVDGKTIKIKIKPAEDDMTGLTIGVGMGDQARSQQIYKAIQEQLGQ